MMLTKRMIVFGLAYVFAFSELVVADDTLMGEWVPVSNSSGGLGATRTYDTNGVVSVTLGAVLNMTYKLDDGMLIRNMDGSPLPPQALAIDGDTLTLTDPESKEVQRLTRIKGSNGDGIVGKWTGDHNSGAKQVMHFTTNGNCYFIMTMRTMMGTFSQNGNILTEVFPKEGKVQWKWEVKDDVLTIAKSAGRKSKIEKYQRKN